MSAARSWKFCPDFVCRIRAVEQKRRTLAAHDLQHVDALHKLILVAGDKVGLDESDRACLSDQGQSADGRPYSHRISWSHRQSIPAHNSPVFSPMILMLFLLAPTVPSAPSPKKQGLSQAALIGPGNPGRSQGSYRVTSSRMPTVNDCAVISLASSSKTPRAMPGRKFLR